MKTKQRIEQLLWNGLAGGYKGSGVLKSSEPYRTEYLLLEGAKIVATKEDTRIHTKCSIYNPYAKKALLLEKDKAWALYFLIRKERRLNENQITVDAQLFG